MDAEGRDDYSADIRFGEWLRSQRIRTNLSLEEAAKKAEISPDRLKALEMGLSARGITHAEGKRLSATYRLEGTELIARASGK